MKTYIALLRGINVSGQKIIKMEVLRKSLESLDLANVSTYIQSGNILFRSALADAGKLEALLHDHIEKEFGFDVSVLVVTPDDLRTVIAQNPFADEKIEEPQPYVSFLSQQPSEQNLEALQAMDFQQDRFIGIDKTLYIHYADGAGKTKLSNAVIERKLKLTATARNWKTVQKLLELAEAMA